MLFKPKFFLDLGSEGEQQTPVTIAPPTAKAKPAAEPKAAPAPSTAAKAAAVTAAPSATAPEAEAPVQPVTSLTTAEAIAAELAAEQASRPAPTLSTFAPDCVTAGGALPRGRRRGSADLGGFREMARGMLSS
jgi:hypothetical protein